MFLLLMKMALNHTYMDSFVCIYIYGEQAFYRAAKAAFFLGLLVEAASYCQSGLELNSENEELKKLFLQVNARKEELEKHNACVSKVVSEAKVSLFLPFVGKRIQFVRFYCWYSLYCAWAGTCICD